MIAKLIIMALGIIAAVIILFGFLGPEGGITRVAGKDLVKTLLPIDINKSEADSFGKASIPESHLKSIIKLNKTIQKMLKGEEDDCFINFGGFPDLGIGGTSMVMVYDPEKDETRFSIYGGAGGKQLVTDLMFSVKGMAPCVISGADFVTENFDDKFLDKDDPVSGDYYSAVAWVKIGRDDGGITGYTENRINFGNGFKDFEGQEWLFTPDNKHICFFPTKDGNGDCDGDDGELDDDCFKMDDEEGIAYQVSRGELDKCFG